MTDPVARLNAALEGRYAIERELGEGGMATVYLAEDLKHERKVGAYQLAMGHTENLPLFVLVSSGVLNGQVVPGRLA